MTVIDLMRWPRASLANFLGDVLIKSVIGNGLAAFLIKTATAGLSYGMFVTLAKLMSTTEYGYFALGFSIAMLVSALGNLGLNTAVLRFLPEHIINGRTDLARGLLVFSANATCIASVLVAGLLVAGQFLLRFLRPDDNFTYLSFAALLVPALAAGEFLASVLRARGRTLWALTPRDIFWRGGVLAVAFVLVSLGVKLTGNSSLLVTAAILAVAILGQAIYTGFMFHAELRQSKPVYCFNPWIKAAMPMWGASTLFMAIQQADILVIGLWLSPEQTARYFAALKTASLLGLMLIAGNLVSAPLISHYFHGNNRAQLARLCRLLAVCLSVPTVLGFGFLIVAGRSLLAWFDPTYTAAYPLLLVLAAGFTIDAISGPTSYFQQMTGRERTYLRIAAVTYFAALAAQCIFTPLFGAFGAAVPNVLGVLACNVWSVLSLRREFHMDCSVFGLLYWPKDHYER